MKITSTQDRTLSLIRALLHGDSGAGKTTSLLTLPEDITLIVGMDRGLVPLRKKNYRVVWVETWQDLRDLVKAFAAAEPGKDGAVSIDLNGERMDNIKILGVDTLNDCNTLAKKQIIEVDRRALYTERTNGKTERPSGMYDDLLGKEDYNLLATRMGNFIGAMVHLPVHVIFTSLSTWKEYSHTGTTCRVPALNGNLAFDCPAWFDLVMHMAPGKDAEGNDCRLWQTFNDGTIWAKDASGCLDPYEHPNWPNVFGKILGRKQESRSKKDKEQEHATA